MNVASAPYTTGIGETDENDVKYWHYTNIPGLTKIASKTMTTFQSEQGKHVYVTVVTGYSNDHVIARNYRYDTGNVMLIKEDGCLKAINGQKVEEIQEILDD